MNGVWGWLSEWLEGFGEPLDAVIDHVQALDPAFRALLAGLAALLETNVLTGVVAPGDAFMLVASAAVQSPGEGLLLGICVSVGSFLGQVAGYGLGRWVGPKVRRRKWLRRRADSARTGPAARMVERRAGPWILMSRFLPVLRSVTPFVVGANDYPFLRFVAWSAPACVLWSAVYVPLYAVASSSLRDDNGSPFLGGVLVVVGLVLFAGASLAQRFIQRRHDQQAVPASEAG